ncbi:MAG: hypothetical protein HKM98_10970 [Gammaproteobacteria bacterium]|nr:hypothetical protein [Gammaproteobacteria bacterium]
MLKSKVTSLLIILALLLPSSALANKITKLDVWALEGFNEAPLIKVYSTNGESWNAVDDTVPVVFKVRLNAKCRFEGRGNKAYEGDLQIAGFEIIGDTDPAHFLIPHSSTAQGLFRYAGGADQPVNVLNACKTELTKRMSENADMSKYEVLAKGLEIKYPGAFKVKYRMFCHATGLGKSDLGSDSTLVNARIQCAASDLAASKIPKPEPVPAKPARLVSLIKAVTFDADPAQYQGKCPVGVRFNGKITSNRAGTVKYRYISHDGRESPTFTLKFARAETKATRKWSRTLSKPDTKNKIAMPGGRASKWDHQGWQRLDVLEPKPTGSVTANYKVDCKTPDPAKTLKIN